MSKASDFFEEGNNYYFGKAGKEKDTKKARKCYKKAAKKGHFGAKKQLLILNNPNIDTAQKWYELGEEYYNAKPPDYVNARACYRLAIDIDASHKNSQFSLGWLYEYGQGVDEDLDKAKKHYTTASKKGHLGAKKQLLILNNPNIDTAQKWYELREEYYNAKPPDYVNARACYKLATDIDASHKDSQFSLGWLYEYGQGVDANLDKAKKHYTKAAKKGHADSKEQLGEAKFNMLYLKPDPFHDAAAEYTISMAPMNSSGDIYHILAYIILAKHYGYSVPRVQLAYDAKTTKAQVAYSSQSDHSFRFNPISDSSSNQSRIPVVIDQLFHFKPIDDSDGIRSKFSAKQRFLI